MRSKFPKWFIILTAVVTLLGGLTVLGFVMPWNALAKEDADLRYETKEHAAEARDRIELHLQQLETGQHRIEATQKTILEILLKE